MKIVDIRPLRPGEAEKFWSGTEGRWRYLVECNETRKLKEPFDLNEIIGERSKIYAPVITFKSCFIGDHAYPLVTDQWNYGVDKLIGVNEIFC